MGHLDAAIPRISREGVPGTSDADDRRVGEVTVVGVVRPEAVEAHRLALRLRRGNDCHQGQGEDECSKDPGHPDRVRALPGSAAQHTPNPPTRFRGSR